MFRRLVVAYMLCVLVVAPALAVEDSITHMKLVNSATFTNRVQWLAWNEAAVVLAEALNTACHAKRVQFALAVLTSPASQAQSIAMAISRSNAGGRVILGTVVDNVNPALIDSSATDLALVAALQFYWNSLAKCETGA